MAARKPTTPVTRLRAAILSFLKDHPLSDSGAIRKHLGLPEYDWLPLLNQALRSRHIIVDKVHPVIGHFGKTELIAATPISLYSLRAS